MSTVNYEASVLLIGGHDTGKSNYVGRLWLALRRGDGLLATPDVPEQIEYVEGLIASLQEGTYAGRTESGDEPRTFEGDARIQSGPHEGRITRVVVPDVHGELWETASAERELDASWVKRLRTSAGALLFLRFGSKHHVEALDWITSAQAMRTPIAQMAGKGEFPTQLFLTDMLNLLELHLGKDLGGGRPRVSVVVAAWDSLPENETEGGPLGYIERNYPMFGGRLSDHGRLDTKAFGTSITGGDLKTDAHKEAFLLSSADKEGYVVYQGSDGNLVKREDLTIPVAWAVGVELQEAE